MAMGTLQVNVLESVDGVNYVLNSTAVATGLTTGLSMVSLTVKPGVRYAKIRLTEEGVGPTSASCEAGIM